MRFRSLPLRLQVLLLTQGLTAVVTAYLLWKPAQQSDWGLLAFLVLCGIIGGACKVDVDIKVGELSLGFTITYFALLQLGIPAALLVDFCGTVAAIVCDFKDGKRRLEFRRLFTVMAAFNYGNGLLATAAMGLTYMALGGHVGQLNLTTMALPILASALSYYLVNTGGVTLASAWAQNLSPWRVFKEHWAWAWPGFLAGACISAALLWTYQRLDSGPGLLLLLPPAYLVYYFYRLRTEKVQGDIVHMQDLNRLNDAIIGSLAMAIEAKDRYTRKHVNRVREYAVRLGQKLGLSSDEIQALRIASLLHDIGKIGIPENILCKPGKLTFEEFEIIKSHVDIGAAILERINFPWPVAPIVRTHHERWDGLGYPRGFKGEEIPVGGRIISLVDVYDALTSDRPYRKAIPRDQAIQILRAGSGSQFDPVVVETFISILPEMDEALARIQAEVDAEEEAIAAMPEPPAPTPPQCDEAEDAVVLGELADLVRSEPGIVVMAPALMERIGKLVPFTTGAIFLKGSGNRNLIPIYATGLWLELLDSLEIRVGEGVSGYVAAKGEPLLNAAAALDLARRLRPSENLELNSTLCVPLMLNGDIIGVITLYHSSYNFYLPFHVERLERISHYAVQAIEQSRRSHRDLPLPSEDTVTKLPNSHALNQFLGGELTIAQTREEEFTVVTLALEATSSEVVQEQLERDQVMQSVARILNETVRDNDFVARSSTNSFALVLSGCGESQAKRTARRIMERARREGLSHTGSSVIMRVGIAVYPRDGASSESLLSVARDRLAELPEPAPRREPAAHLLPEPLEQPALMPPLPEAVP